MAGCHVILKMDIKPDKQLEKNKPMGIDVMSPVCDPTAVETSQT
jgi:hypothetical protein